MISLLFALSFGAADELKVYVMTFGPGDHPFYKFGHNAIWVHDPEKKTDYTYNYGAFDFDSPLLIPEFLKGKLRYWLAVSGLQSTIGTYKYEGRTVFTQELNLTPDQKQQIYDALELNALPANRYYKYDYYLDNCSTRVRDMVDRAVQGALHDASRAPAQLTWRDHTRRSTEDFVLVYLGLDLAMGSFIDKPIDQWEEMFLPEKLREGLRRVNGTDGQPLVKAEKQLVDAPHRKPISEKPPVWWQWFLLAGIGVGSLLAFVPRLRPVGVVAGTVFGLLGCIFVMFWVATDHLVAHHNENIFLCAPFAVLLPWRRLRPQLATAALAFAVLGLLFKVLPWSLQRNAEFICFFLPFWCGLWWSLRRRELSTS